MHKPTNYYSPQMIARLTGLLEQVKDEIVAFEATMTMANEVLHDTIRSLSLECRQHATEIMGYIYCFEGKADLPVLQLKTETGSNQHFFSDDEMLQRFREAEQRLLAAYRTALNEPLFTHDVRALLRRQFNSLQYLFMQSTIADAAH